MKLKSLATSLFVTALTASALTLSPVDAQATQAPKPGTQQYQLATYHYGSITGEVIGQYAYAGPCGDAFWWGDTSAYVTTTWVTCPGH